ncbi:MAG: TonB-dependent receptor [bacterium]|nr:TonB-dependent receptor [bacterium]
MKINIKVTFILIIAIFSSAASAGTTGKLVGRVTDSQTREGLPGVNVTLEKTNLGGITDSDGYYFIMNIPSGTYNAKAYVLSYRESRQESVYIGADMTVKLNFKMLVQSIEMDSVYVEAHELVSKSITQQEKTISRELLERDAGGDITAAIKRQPGIVEDEQGKIHIRGGREDEISYMIDGMSIVEPIFRTQQLQVSKGFVNEVKLITGGFNAEYGEAISGVINLLSREGSLKPSFSILFEGNSFLPGNLNNGDSRISLQYGGPVIRDKLFLFSSGEIYVSDYFTPKYHSIPSFYYQNDSTGYAYYFDSYDYDAHFDEYGRFLWDSTLTQYKWSDDSVPYFRWGTDTVIYDRVVYGDTVTDTIFRQIPIIDTVVANPYNQDYIDSIGHIFPHNRHSHYNGQMKLTLSPFSAFKLSANAIYSKFSSEILNNNLKYNPDRGLNENGRSLNANIFGNFLFNKSNLIVFSANYTSNKSTLTHGFPDTIYLDNGDGTVDTLAPQSEYHVEWYEFWRDYSVISEEDFENLQKPDEKFINNNPWGFNPFTSTDEDACSYMYPYYYGLYRSYISNSYQLKLDWQCSINQFNESKTGIDLTLFEAEMLSMVKPWTESFSKDKFKVNPFKLSFYAQDKLEFELMVLNFGARVDIFDSRAPYYSDRFNTHKEPLYLTDTVISGDDTSFVLKPNIEPDTIYDDGWPVEMSDKKVSFSPRFGISYPMAPNTYLRFNYGHFYQTPQFSYLFSNLVSDVLTTDNNVIFGNPDLQPEHSISYEMEVESEIRKNFYFAFSAFYKDFFNLISARSVNDSDEFYFEYMNEDYANSKGVEVSFGLYERVISFNGSYTLSYATGTSSDSEEKFNNYSYFYDPETGEDLSSITSTKYVDFDQRHTFNFSYTFSTDYTNINKSAKNLDVTFFHVIKSGKPYNGTFASLSNLFDNSSRMPWGFYTDFKVSKKFHLGTLIGSISLKANNLFDVKNIIDVYDETGMADSDGNLGNLRLEDFKDEYVLGETEYDSRQDIDNDGKVTPLEQYNVYLETYKDYSYNPHNYAAPRTVMIAFELSF